MARIRSIRPELFEAKRFATMPSHLQLLLLKMVSLADDEGLLRAESHYIYATRYSYDEDLTPAQIEAWVPELVRSGWIRTYDHQGDLYAEIIGWCDKRHLLYQVINQPSASRLPAPPPPENPSGGSDYGSPAADLPYGSGSGSGSGREGKGSDAGAREDAPAPDARPLTLETAITRAKEASARREKRLRRPAAKRADVYREGYVARLRPAAMGAGVLELFPREPEPDG